MNRFCTACGRPLEAGSRFCTGCGIPTPRVTASNQPAQTAPSSAPPKLLRVLAGVAVLAAAFVALIAAFPPDDQYNSITSYWNWDYSFVRWDIVSLIAPLVVAGIIALSTLPAPGEWTLGCTAAGIIVTGQLLALHLLFQGDDGILSGDLGLNTALLVLATLLAVAGAGLALFAVVPMGQVRLTMGPASVVLGGSAALAVALAGAFYPLRDPGRSFFALVFDGSSARVAADLLIVVVPTACVGIAGLLGPRARIAVVAVIEAFGIALVGSSLSYLDANSRIAAGLAFGILAVLLLAALGGLAAYELASERRDGVRTA